MRVVIGPFGEDNKDDAGEEEEGGGVRMVLPHIMPPFSGILVLFFVRTPTTPPPGIGL